MESKYLKEKKLDYIVSHDKNLIKNKEKKIEKKNW